MSSPKLRCRHIIAVVIVLVEACNRGSPSPPHTTNSVSHTDQPTVTTGRRRDASVDRMPTSDSPSAPAAQEIHSPCLTTRGSEGASTTVQLLASLDHMMAGFGPPMDTFQAASTPAACLTAIAARNNPSGAATERARAQQAQIAERAARSAYQVVLRDWNATTRLAAWSWDAQWQTRPPGSPAVYGCYIEASNEPQQSMPCAPGSRHMCTFGGYRPGEWDPPTTSRENCNGQWRVRHPAGLSYFVDGQPREPELTRRVRTDGTLHPEQDQSCIVLSAVLDGTDGLITCDTSRIMDSYEIRVPQEAVAVGGVLATLGVGDLVRIHGHSLLRKRFVGENTSHWQFSGISASGITIVEHSTCCAAPVSQPSGADAGVSAPPTIEPTRHHRHR